MTDRERIRRKELYEKEFKPAYEALMKGYPFTLNDLDGEIWRDVYEYEGLYQVSNFGRVKSFCKGAIKILKPAITRNGYFQVMLYKNRKQQLKRIHRLVAQAFIPNPEVKPEVNHIDGCKSNNFVGNLEWVTSSGNQFHAYAFGLQVGTQGENNYQAGMTNEQAVWCRSVYVPGHPKFGATALANLFGLSDRSIRAILHGETYRNVGGQIHELIHKPRVPIEVRQQIRNEYIYGSSEFGIYALARKFAISHDTIKRILHEND